MIKLVILLGLAFVMWGSWAGLNRVWSRDSRIRNAAGCLLLIVGAVAYFLFVAIFLDR